MARGYPDNTRNNTQSITKPALLDYILLAFSAPGLSNVAANAASR
jgi:hypothetical protein